MTDIGEKLHFPVVKVYIKRPETSSPTNISSASLMLLKLCIKLRRKKKKAKSKKSKKHQTFKIVLLLP